MHHPPPPRHTSATTDHLSPFGDRPSDEPTSESVIYGVDVYVAGVDVYVAGVDDRVAQGQTVRIQRSSNERWVGSIDSELGEYADIQLELRLPVGTLPRTTTFGLGPEVEGETLIWGLGPAPSVGDR